MTTPSAADVVNTLLARDRFSQWLGIEVLEADVGRSVLRMTIRDDILFSLADSAFAFATNAGGVLSVAIDCTVSFPVAVRPGDVLTATAIEQSTTKRLAFVDVTVRNQDDVIAGHFRGTVYRTAIPHQL